jgi:hypothetical protein
MTVVVLVVYPLDHSSKSKLRHRMISGQAVKQITSTRTFTFTRNQQLLYMPEQRYSANDSRKDFVINHNESDQYRPVIDPARQFRIPTLYLLSLPDGYDYSSPLGLPLLFIDETSLRMNYY